MGTVAVIVHRVSVVVDEVPSVDIIYEAILIVIDIGRAIELGEIDPHFIFEVLVVFIYTGINDGDDLVGVRNSRIGRHTSLDRICLYSFIRPLLAVECVIWLIGR